jgi:hypothetical protein
MRGIKTEKNEEEVDRKRKKEKGKEAEGKEW